MQIIIYKYYNDNLQNPNVSSKTFELFFFGGVASRVDHFPKKKKKNTAELKCWLAELFQMDGFLVFGEGGKSSHPSEQIKKHAFMKK